MKKYLPEIGITVLLVSVFLCGALSPNSERVLMRGLYWLAAFPACMFVLGSCVYAAFRIIERAEKWNISYYFACVLALLMVVLFVIGVRTVSAVW